MANIERQIQIQLRNLRDKLAREHNIEFYKIFNNETLELISREKPTTNIELLSIKGIGPSKSKKFGKQIISIVETSIENSDAEEESTHNEEGKQKVYSVGEFLDHFNLSFARKPLAIRGEVVDLKRPRPGIIYFSLKDEDDDALITCFMRSHVEDNVGTELEDGMSVVVSGYLGAYKPSGRFSLQVTEFLLEGEGALQLAFEELKRKLEKDGLFADSRKRAIPSYVRCIGLITAKGSDAERDFSTHVGKFGFCIKRVDVRVEGLRAVDQICSALTHLNQYEDDIDVIVVTRGGGSLESLQAFNSERVARAIAASRVPVISGVGHEKDVTIADLVADVRASTPTHAGKLISEDWVGCSSRVQSICSTLHLNAHTTVTACISQTDTYCRGFGRVLERTLMVSTSRIGERLNTLSRAALQIFEQFGFLEQMFNQNLSRIKTSLDRSKQKVDQEKQNLLYRAETNLERIARALVTSEQRIELASPTARLKQGYSIALSGGKVVRDASSLKKGQKLTVEFHKGAAETVVEDVVE